MFPKIENLDSKRFQDVAHRVRNLDAQKARVASFRQRARERYGE